MQRAIKSETIFVVYDLVMKNFWVMKKESKYDRSSRRQAVCSCSILKKGITNLAKWAVQERN